jgi:deoxyribose-phosphate aldolase
MAIGIAESETGYMNETEQLEQLRKQMESLYQNLRTVRHAINNHVAVIMAMAELSQRNPAQAAKLAQICLEKAPQIAASVGGFTELFNGAVSIQREVENQGQPPTANA